MKRHSEILTLDEASALLRIPIRQCAIMATRDEIPAVVVGSYLRFSRTALLEHVRTGRVTPAAGGEHHAD